jgi:Tfp pilus assembly ATPase PilU
MQTFDQCLTELVRSGEVTFDIAKAASSNPSDFELRLNVFSNVASDSVDEAADEVVVGEPAGAPLDAMQSGGLDFLNS